MHPQPLVSLVDVCRPKGFVCLQFLQFTLDSIGQRSQEMSRDQIAQCHGIVQGLRQRNASHDLFVFALPEVLAALPEESSGAEQWALAFT